MIDLEKASKEIANEMIEQGWVCEDWQGGEIQPWSRLKFMNRTEERYLNTNLFIEQLNMFNSVDKKLSIFDCYSLTSLVELELLKDER